MMTLFLAYNLKVAVLIAVFYIFWHLLVVNATWHRLNRIVLLSTAVASFVLPLCVITVHQTVEVMPAVTETLDVAPSMEEMAMPPEAPSLETTVDVERPFDWSLLLTVVYIAGVLVVLSRMLLSLWRLHRMTLESEIHPLADGRQIAVSDEAKTPFSWWKTVFMSKIDYEAGTTALLTHELGHIRLHHSQGMETKTRHIDSFNGNTVQGYTFSLYQPGTPIYYINELSKDQEPVFPGNQDQSIAVPVIPLHPLPSGKFGVSLSVLRANGGNTCPSGHGSGICFECDGSASRVEATAAVFSLKEPFRSERWKHHIL